MVSSSREGKASEHYKKYKESYVKQLRFDPEKPNLSINLLLLLEKIKHTFSSAALVEQTPLEEVYIFFDTATYDEIARDVKVTFF